MITASDIPTTGTDAQKRPRNLTESRPRLSELRLHALLDGDVMRRLIDLQVAAEIGKGAR